MNVPKTLVGVLGVLAASAGLAAHAAETYDFTPVNRLIPEGDLAGMSDRRSLTSAVRQVTSLRVKLRIDGEFNGDLYGYVRHIGSGRTNLCVLLNRPGRTASQPAGYADAGLDVVFDDAAASGDIHLYRAVVAPSPGTPLTGVWQPDGRKVDPVSVSEGSSRTTTLGSFTGADASGEWTLYVVDAETGGTNRLASWGLEISGASAPPVSWPAPVDMVYGTPLGPEQCNASSSVAGTFSYDPPPGTVLEAGAGQTLSVTFTPQETNDYVAVTTHVSLNVLNKALTITADSANKVYGAPVPEFAARYNGFVKGDGPSALDSPVTLATAATANSDVGTYPVTASGAADANYAITFEEGTLTITPAAVTGTLGSSANPALPGEPVTFTCALSAIPPGAGTLTGRVQFKVDGTMVGEPVPLSGGVAAYATSMRSAGFHRVTAEYAGSPNFIGTTNTLVPDQLINTPPVAGTDTVERWPTNGTKVAIAALLANDTDADGDTILWMSFSATSVHGGTVTQSEGWLTYTPPPGFTNTDQFTYAISDGRGVPASGTVTVALKVNLVPSPNLTILDLNGTYEIGFDGVPNATYRIEYTDNLDLPDWQVLGSATADDSGRFTLVDTPPEGARARYYRSVHP